MSLFWQKILTPVTLRIYTFWTFKMAIMETGVQSKCKSPFPSLETSLWSLTFEVDCPGCCQWLLVAGVLAQSTRRGCSIPRQRRPRYRAGAARAAADYRAAPTYNWFPTPLYICTLAWFGQDLQQTNQKLKNKLMTELHMHSNEVSNVSLNPADAESGCLSSWMYYRYPDLEGARQTSGFPTNQKIWYS